MHVRICGIHDDRRFQVWRRSIPKCNSNYVFTVSYSIGYGSPPRFLYKNSFPNAPIEFSDPWLSARSIASLLLVLPLSKHGLGNICCCLKDMLLHLEYDECSRLQDILLVFCERHTKFSKFIYKVDFSWFNHFKAPNLNLFYNIYEYWTYQKYPLFCSSHLSARFWLTFGLQSNCETFKWHFI
jgi:hypothetical protein